LNEDVCVLNSQNWEAEVLGSELPVLVDFWAAWCPPCKLIAPAIDALASEFKGRAKVGKLDVEADGDVAGRYGIRSIPTLLVFRGGEVVDQRVGALPEAELTQMLEQQLGDKAPSGG
jgi:thioredoxin 1